jgi:uncharacterized protein
MTLASRVFGRALHLSAPTHKVGVETDLPATMRDGTTLLADRYFPRDAPDAPIVLMRTPYGRRTRLPTDLPLARLFAERGYQCVNQSVRGTFGSGGTFEPFRDERSDGADTLAWLEQQPWFCARVGLWGGSYVGCTAWAAAVDAPSYVKALCLIVTGTNVYDVFYPGGVLSVHPAHSNGHVSSPRKRNRSPRCWAACARTGACSRERR